MSIPFYNDLNANGLTVVNGRVSAADGEMVVHQQIQDFALESYVDDAVAGLPWKEEVITASTANHALASLAAGANVGGIALTTGDLFLLKDQTDPIENGVYVAGVSGPPVRATTFDATAEVNNAIVPILSGTNQGTNWRQTAIDPTVDADSITFVQFNGGSYTAGDGLLLNALDFAVNVDDSTIEIDTDALRVKDGGIGVAKLNDVTGKSLNSNTVFTGALLGDTDSIDSNLQALETAVEAVDTLDTYTVALSVTASGGTQTVTHSLASDNILIQMLDGTSFIGPGNVQVDKVDTNSFQITNDSGSAMSGQVTVIAA